MDTDPFPPTRDEALARIAAVRPSEYARTRNALGGAVSRLSPYIAHGLVTLPEVLAGVRQRHRLEPAHKFVFELGWREYFHHVWAHRGDGIFASLHAGPRPDDAYARAVPADVRAGRTGVPAIDAALAELAATGWLHNHARMWLASYLVHVRGVHWRTGANWLWSRLIDGDLASNNLSWQWVAGTGSHRPYLFNAENVARHAPPAWHSPGSVIDQPYEALERLAHRPGRAVQQADRDDIDPDLHAAPPADLGTTVPRPGELAGRAVWLVTPWALRPPPALSADTLRVAVLPAEWHAARPFSAARWAFVSPALAALAPVRWHAPAADLAAALREAAQVALWDEPHALHALADVLPPGAQAQPWPRLFREADRPCASFSQWWTRVMRPIRRVDDLPGLQAWARDAGAGPLFDVLPEGLAHDPVRPDPRADHRRTRWHRP